MLEINAGYLIAICFISSFVICYKSIPTIVHIAREKKLYDAPNERSSHITPTPSLGGVAIFFGFTISTLIFSYGINSSIIKYTIISSIIMFATGLKDDILIISPKKKFLLQIFSATLIVVLGDVRITNLYGLLGVNEINYFISIPMSIIFIVFVTNSLNLIDGIDGLSSGLTIIISSFFGLWYYLEGYTDLAILSTALIGSAVAFFYHNVYGKTTKIFMGDTGSLIIGMIISALIITFMKENVNANLTMKFNNAPAVVFAAMIIPFFDTLRVFSVRLSKGQSPFKADKNHLHHHFINVGLSHISSSMILMLINILSIAIVLETSLPMEVIISGWILAMSILIFVLKTISKNKLKQKRIKPIIKSKIRGRIATEI
jgi:UDP-N-acetylmuramyl pentapeptide phosphotransferase/UDP-N-acetylglucosamine-1-phosphate transferase